MHTTSTSRHHQLDIFYKFVEYILVFRNKIATHLNMYLTQYYVMLRNCVVNADGFHFMNKKQSIVVFYKIIL